MTRRRGDAIGAVREEDPETLRRSYAEKLFVSASGVSPCPRFLLPHVPLCSTVLVLPLAHRRARGGIQLNQFDLE